MRRIVFLIIFLTFIFGLTVNSYADTIIVSLAGDRDNFGTGAPLGSPINSWIGENGVRIHPDMGDSPFDIARVAAPETWIHSFCFPKNNKAKSATLTIVTWDLEDGGAGDGHGGGPYDTRLYLDGIEILRAFDDTYSPDVGPSFPNITTFILDRDFLRLLDDGVLNVIMDPGAGEAWDMIAIDYAELTIHAVPVPEPSLMVLLGISVMSLVGLRRW